MGSDNNVLDDSSCCYLHRFELTNRQTFIRGGLRDSVAMEVNEIQEFVRDSLHDGGEGEPLGLRLIAAKLGQYAELQVKLAALPKGRVPQQMREQMLGDVLAATVFVVAHAAEDEGIDLGEKVESRYDAMKETKAKQSEWEDALEEGDVEAIRGLVEEQIEEGDVDLFGDDEEDTETQDTGSGRGVY